MTIAEQNDGISEPFSPSPALPDETHMVTSTKFPPVAPNKSGGFYVRSKTPNLRSCAAVYVTSQQSHLPSIPFSPATIPVSPLFSPSVFGVGNSKTRMQMESETIPINSTHLNDRIPTDKVHESPAKLHTISTVPVPKTPKRTPVQVLVPATPHSALRTHSILYNSNQNTAVTPIRAVITPRTVSTRHTSPRSLFASPAGDKTPTTPLHQSAPLVVATPTTSRVGLRKRKLIYPRYKFRRVTEEIALEAKQDKDSSEKSQFSTTFGDEFEWPPSPCSSRSPSEEDFSTHRNNDKTLNEYQSELHFTEDSWVSHANNGNEDKLANHNHSMRRLSAINDQPRDNSLDNPCTTQPIENGVEETEHISRNAPIGLAAANVNNSNQQSQSFSNTGDFSFTFPALRGSVAMDNYNELTHESGVGISNTNIQKNIKIQFTCYGYQEPPPDAQSVLLDLRTHQLSSGGSELHPAPFYSHLDNVKSPAKKQNQERNRTNMNPFNVKLMGRGSILFSIFHITLT